MEIHGDTWRSREIHGDSGSSGSSYLELLLAAQQRAHARSDLELVEQLWGKVGSGKGEGGARRGGHLHAGAGGRSRASSITRKIIPVREGHPRQSEAITCGNERKIISVPILALPPARIPFTMVRSGALASGTMPSSADAFEK
jgi:hypothetical protein